MERKRKMYSENVHELDTKNGTEKTPILNWFWHNSVELGTQTQTHLRLFKSNLELEIQTKTAAAN